MTRIFHLSHLLDKDGYNRIDLISFYELSRLDDYIIKRFKNHKDVRHKFNLDISEFCLSNMKMIQDENKKNQRNWTGSIAIICEERDQNDKVGLMYKIPIIYQGESILPKEVALRKIKDKLADYNTILKVFENKKELLSQNERELILLYKKNKNTRYLKSAVGFFYNRLKRIEDDELLYFYCRALMRIFELNELKVKTNFGEINHISNNIPNDTILVKTVSHSDDVYFTKLIDEDNYEELFNTYDIDEIDRNSDMFRKEKNL